MIPELLKLKPAGRLPLVSVQVSGAVPPMTPSVSL
jgi:hypothetical protein